MAISIYCQNSTVLIYSNNSKFQIMNGINLINFRLSHQQIGGVPGYGKYFMGQVWCLIVSILDICPLSYFDYLSCFVCAAWQPSFI